MKMTHYMGNSISHSVLFCKNQTSSWYFKHTAIKMYTNNIRKRLFRKITFKNVNKCKLVYITFTCSVYIYFKTALYDKQATTESESESKWRHLTDFCC